MHFFCVTFPFHFLGWLTKYTRSIFHTPCHHVMHHLICSSFTDHNSWTSLLKWCVSLCLVIVNSLRSFSIILDMRTMCLPHDLLFHILTTFLRFYRPVHYFEHLLSWPRFFIFIVTYQILIFWRYALFVAFFPTWLIFLRFSLISRRFTMCPTFGMFLITSM